jgi:hypothetical protein
VISLNTVKSFCRGNDINENIEDKSSAVLTGETTVCENCEWENHQIAKQKRKRFCCDKCRNTWWNSYLNQVKRKTVYDFKCPYCEVQRSEKHGNSRNEQADRGRMSRERSSRNLSKEHIHLKGGSR